MSSFDEILTSLKNCVITEDQPYANGTQKIGSFFDKLSECSRIDVKRSKERSLEEAVHLLKTVTLQDLEQDHFQLLVRLVVTLQLQMAHISTACRKVDKMLQHLAMVDHQLVFAETHFSLSSIVHSEQMFTQEDLQRGLSLSLSCLFGASMLMEDSTMGRDVWQELCLSFLKKLAKFFPFILQEESLRDGQLCYLAVKVCLQVFQLLSSVVSSAVWNENQWSPAMQIILQALTEVMFGQSTNRDTRLLAGTAVAMLINTAPDSSAGAAAAWNLLQSSHSESCLLPVGAVHVQHCPTTVCELGWLSMIRGLLTCCRPRVLLSSREEGAEGSLLFDVIFPMLYDFCEKLNCHYLAFEVLTLWLKKVTECVSDIWKMTGGRLLSESSSTLQQQLISIIWTSAESPVEGVSDCARINFCLLLDLYDMDCKQFGDTKKSLHLILLQQIIQLPWESKAKYHRLCALLPYLGTDTVSRNALTPKILHGLMHGPFIKQVLKQYAELQSHFLKCMSKDHLAPFGSELYKSLIQQQRKELCGDSLTSLSESELGNRWAERWLPVLIEALTSHVVFLQRNSSTHLLPCTFQVFPSAVEPLLASLDPFSPGHLCAWAFIMSSYRAVTGGSPWAVQGSSTMKILHLALGSADDRVRLASVNLLCCSPKSKDTPTPEELAIMRSFIPQNLNSESSLFRQHFQTAVRKFLVRIRDGCLAGIKQQKEKVNASQMESAKKLLAEGVGFVDWLNQMVFCNLTPDHSYQRKKTVLLLLSALLETCTDTWSPDKRKGQPPVNMGSLVNYARMRGQWNFFSREKLLVLICCLEDSTNEIRELSAGLLVRFFPPVLPVDVAEALLIRTKQLLCSPRVQQAQMAALMMKVLHHKANSDISVNGAHNEKASSFIGFLVKELEAHYLTAKINVMLAARTKPMHGVLSALQNCLLEDTCNVFESLGPALTIDLLNLLKNISLLLLGVMHGQHTESDAPPSFCDMGNAISSLIENSSGGNPEDGRNQCVLLSEEHCLVLTCCWVSLKETGILLGFLVERILAESKPDMCFLTKQHLETAADIFQNILLKCRHWGAVEGCGMGFTRFCSALLSTQDPELRNIPFCMLQQGLHVLTSPSCTSVTRRAAGLPMLILCVLTAEEASKARPLLAHSMKILLDTARSPLAENWDQTRDLPQVCAVHTLQALVRGSGLGVAILQFAPTVTILALTLLSSPCWAMRNAALQLYSSLCSRMLGQRPSSEAGTKHAMSPKAFFHHYSKLQPFLLRELREAACDLQCPPEEARLRLHPSLYPILTLLSQLQPGVQDSTDTLADFLSPLLQLSASPIYCVRVMASKALVAMTPPAEYMNILIKLTAQLPRKHQGCCHNRLHGQLLDINALLDRALGKDCGPSPELKAVVCAVEDSVWLATDAQRCPLVRAAYVAVVDSLRRFCCETFLSNFLGILKCELHKPQQGLQVGLSSFHQQAIQFVCSEPKWASDILETFRDVSCDLRLALVTWVLENHASLNTHLKELIQNMLLTNLRKALLSPNKEYRRTHLAAMVEVMAGGDSLTAPFPLEESALLECLDLLLKDLEDKRGGSEFLSQALHGASLLLPQCPQDSVIQRWCGVLESHRSPDAVEVVRIACAEALCVAGLPLMSQHLIPPTVIIKLLSTGLDLLQDQSQVVRSKAASFISMLHHARGKTQRSVYLTQVNLAIPLLLDLLLEECWDTSEALEVLLYHVPSADLKPVLREAVDTGCGSLYEQDDANVFAEPSVMCVHVLPYLLLLVEKYVESSVLAQSLRTWAIKNATLLLDNLALCKDLQPAQRPTLLTDPRFHSTICGLLTRATFLLRLSKTWERHFCDPSALQVTLKDVFNHLSQQGVHVSSALISDVTGDVRHGFSMISKDS